MAGLSNTNDDDDLISGINVTPLVDIALVLLIIFIATSAIIVRAAIQVDLPRAATAGEALPSTISVVLDVDGNLFLNGQPVTAEAFRAAVAQEIVLDPEVRALIAADSRIDYGSVMQLIDIIRELGVGGFSLNVERVQPSQP